MMESTFLSYLPYCVAGFPLLGFVINTLVALLWAKNQKPGSEALVKLVGCLFPILAFILSLICFSILRNSPEGMVISPPALFRWIDTALLTVDFRFMIDPLTATMMLVVTGVGSLIHIYATGYMHGDQGFARFYAYLNLFLFFMLLLIMGNNLLVLFVGWEGVGLCSYLLIGFWFTDEEKAKCGKKAFIVNRIGDFGFLLGIFLVMHTFLSQSQSSDLNFLDYSFIAQHKDLFLSEATLIALCFFAGAAGKSAQIPLYVWLPDAMAGPTPVSALIHAATMVTAGIFMIARLYFLYELAPVALQVVAIIGLLTALMAASIALTQTDIKKVLAYSTVSQLGYMFLALGVGAPQAAIFHVVTHAFFKACLFLCAGSVIYALHHQQDIRHMGGLFKKIPVTSLLVSTIAIAGIPPLAGFFSKDEILFHTFTHAPRIFYIVGFLVSGLTSFYMFRLFTLVFLGKYRGHLEPHYLPLAMDAPIAILAVLALVGGFIGVPEVLGGTNRISHWLAFLSTEIHGEEVAHHGTELILIGISSAWALITAFMAFSLYLKNPEWTKTLKEKCQQLYNLVSRKYYVDEIYDGIFVRPLVWLSHKFFWKGMDEAIIDGVMVHGFADISLVASRIISRFQSGFLGHYVVFFVLGLIGIMFYLAVG